MSGHTSQEDEEFFAAIGRLAISWAYIEFGLDVAIDIIHRLLGGKKIKKDSPRTSLQRKMIYLRKWSKTVPEPTLGNAIPALLDKIEAASEMRRNLIHGVVINQESGSGEAKMLRIMRDAANRMTPREYGVTTDQILQAAVEANKLGGRSLAFGTGLQDLILVLSEKAEKPDSEVGG